MIKKILALVMAATLCFTTVSCGSNSSQQTSNTRQNPTQSIPQVTSGRYPVQQASYNDADGEYTLMLLNTASGVAPTYRTTQLQMARLTDEQIAKGEKTYLEVKGQDAVMYLTEDFKIEYVHNVTETQTNPQTGQRETVVVRQQSGFWAPFAGAIAGQAVGNLLFSPRYYVPPAYQPGGVITGYGGYGNTYNQAVRQYRRTYNEPPAVVKNRTKLRTTGNLRRNTRTTSGFNRKRTNTTRSTGSGYGSSKLRSSGRSKRVRTNSRRGFGSSTRSRSRSYRRR